MDCKRILAENVTHAFEPFRERAAHFRSNPREVRRILDEGAEKARAIAANTMAEVRQRMGLEWREALSGAADVGPAGQR